MYQSLQCTRNKKNNDYVVLRKKQELALSDFRASVWKYNIFPKNHISLFNDILYINYT